MVAFTFTDCGVIKMTGCSSFGHEISINAARVRSLDLYSCRLLESEIGVYVDDVDSISAEKVIHTEPHPLSKINILTLSIRGVINAYV